MLPLRDTIPSRHRPVATYVIIGINVAVFLFTLRLSGQDLFTVFHLFGVVPRRFTDPAWSAHIGYPQGAFWPFLTSMFLHGGWFHLITNMWILWIFGDNVEDRMGPFRFVVFYVLCGIASAFVHTATNAGSSAPVVGASGAIAGVLAAYVLLYPMAQVLCVVLLIFYPIFFEIPAFVFIVFWFIVQVVSGAFSLLAPGPVSGIAWWAHIGGFLTGLLLAPLFFRRHRHHHQRFPQPGLRSTPGTAYPSWSSREFR